VNVSTDFGQVGKLFGHMRSFVSAFPDALDIYNDKATERLLQLVRQHASGRPGPNVVTGRYLANFMIVDGKVVNPSPQTRRLEYGFVGTDALGRMYHQPPFPHFRPALEEMRAEYRRGIVPLIRTTWNATDS